MPNIPQNNTLCWYFLDFKSRKDNSNYKDVVDTKDNSIKYPVMNLIAAEYGFQIVRIRNIVVSIYQ
jgi:hypothetical protein